MSEVVIEEERRAGEVVRVLAHGTVIIWDPAAERSYPFYKAGQERFRRYESVQFRTDCTDTFVVEVRKSGGSNRRKARHAYMTSRAHLHPR